MTHSSLATKTIVNHGKYNSRQGAAITRVIVHHWAGTSGGDVSLSRPDRQASANYILYSDGTLAVHVPEEYRAWTSGGYSIDQPSITVEVQNSTNGPKWEVSAKAIKTLTALIADIARRYKWGSVNRSRVRGHREFDATACPGPYLYPRLDQIAIAANALLNDNQSASEVTGAQIIEEDEMSIQVFARVDGKKDGEWMRVHPEIGKDLKAGASRKAGNITVFRGYEVTTNASVGAAWGRTHCRPYGNAPSRLARAAYIEIQAQATRLSVELYG